MKNISPRTGEDTPNLVSKMRTKLSKCIGLHHPLLIATFKPILQTFGTVSTQNHAENTAHRVGQKQIHSLKIGDVRMFVFFAAIALAQVAI